MTQWGLDVLFNPAKRHMDDEKRRLQSTREEIGDSSGGKRIDLDSGKVRIPRTEQSDEADGVSEAEPAAVAAAVSVDADAANTDTANTDTADTDAADTEGPAATAGRSGRSGARSSAAERSAERHRRRRAERSAAD